MPSQSSSVGERTRDPRLAVPALWVPRPDFLRLLLDAASARQAGRRFWTRSEPWVSAVRMQAPGPEVLLAELSDWAALLDQHSSLSLGRDGGMTTVTWENLPDLAPFASECAFRRGFLEGLLAPPGRGAPTAPIWHPRCCSRGDDACVFAIDGIVPREDRVHARLLREAAILAGMIRAKEAVARRFEAFSAHIGPFPDVRSLRHLRRFMEEVEDPILLFDRHLWILDANGAAERMSGMTRSELRGLSAKDLLAADSYRVIQKFLPLLFEQGSLSGLVVDGRSRDGLVPLEVSARVSDNRQTIVCIARDISDRLRLERELEERNRLLEERNEQIVESDRLKSEFLANVSHELTTPLACIKGFAKLLLQDDDREQRGDETRINSDQREEFLQIIQKEAERMTDLIRGLLELSKIESGVVTLDRAMVSLNTVVRESILVLKPRLDMRSLRVEPRLDQSLPLARLDPDRIKQVVLNLLDNAIKFSPAGSAIQVTTARSAEALRLAVANPSSELNEADLERIFERFVQRDGSFARPYGGVGLGLNLVRAIVDLHGGRVWAEIPDANRVQVVAEIPL